MFSAFCLFFFGSALCKAQNIESRPNIIFLLTDDHRWDALGYAGNRIIQTPNFDYLANNGISFKNSYVTTAICCISRASILTGQYESRHHINDFDTSMSQAALENTYPLILRKSGYYTGFIGKYGVGNKMPEKEYDLWYGFPGQGTYNHKDKEGNYKHLTELMGDQAEEFLEKADKSKPFCLSMSFKAPHVQGTNTFLPDKKDSALYANDLIPVPRTANEKYWNAFPAFFKQDNEARSRWQVRFSTPQLYQSNVKKYYQLITEVDRVVGRLRSKLAALGLDKNTVIVFTGDNGFYLGEHGLAGKWYGHEESIRVPMIIYDPRAPKKEQGQVRKEIALNIDIAPTILALAGQTAPKAMQGSDLRRLTGKSASAWRTDFFYEHTFSHPKIPKSEGVCGGRYKYLRYIDQNPVYEELYDVKHDPNETVNLASNPKYKKQLNLLRARYNELKKEVL